MRPKAARKLTKSAMVNLEVRLLELDVARLFLALFFRLVVSYLRTIFVFPHR